VIKVVSKIIADYPSNKAGCKAMMDNLVKTVDGYVLGVEDEDPRLKALNEDVSGRVAKSVSTPERYQRWGRHYLRAIVRAHQLQLRTNFMDPGLQVYGGKLFKDLEHRGGEIFVALPMTTGSRYASTSSYSASTSSSTYTAPAVDTTVYYGGGGGGCFDASCSVVVQKEGSESKTDVHQVRKGDLVRVVEDGARAWARVACVVQIERQQQTDLVEFASGLKLTKKHPVRFPGQNWQYPVDLVGKRAVLCKSTSEYVYNFVLDSSHVLLVNDVECVTFGHGISADPVAWDSFYATQRVVNVISEMEGFDSGFVSVRGSLKQSEKHM